MAALHFLLPTGDSRSGRRSFDSKLISLLPLDEVPVHVHRFAARAPCDSKGSQCQCGIHTAEAASALRSRKTERAAKEKPTPISQIFLAPAAPAKSEDPKGGEGKVDANLTNFLSTDAAGWRFRYSDLAPFCAFDLAPPVITNRPNL